MIDDHPLHQQKGSVPPRAPRVLALFGNAIFFGQERANMEALAALQSEGCEVLCLVRDDSWNVVIPAELDRYGLRWEKVKFIENWVPGRHLYFFFRNPLLFFRANIQLLRITETFFPTHIYAFNPYFILNFIVGLKIIRIPLIYYAGDKPPLHNIFWKWAWRLTRWRTAKFVAVSRYIKQQLVTTGVPEDQISVIYCGAPARPALQDDISAKLVKKPGYIYFEFHGQINRNKGVHVLLQAFEQLLSSGVKAKLRIAGAFPGLDTAFAQELKFKVDSSDALRGDVCFLGFVEDIEHLLRLSDVHICPSICGEALGLVVMEAKQASRPSIIFPNGGLPEMVTHGVDGYICPDETAMSLSEAMRHYAENPELVDIQGRIARSSLTKFEIDRFGARWRAEVEAL